MARLESDPLWQGEEIKNSGMASFYRNLKGNVAKLIGVIGSMLILLAVPMRLCQLTTDKEQEAHYRFYEEA